MRPVAERQTSDRLVHGSACSVAPSIQVKRRARIPQPHAARRDLSLESRRSGRAPSRSSSGRLTHGHAPGSRALRRRARSASLCRVVRPWRCARSRSPVLRALALACSSLFRGRGRSGRDDRASWTPLGRDQGIFQYVAWAVAQGDVDYRDVRDVNGPLIALRARRLSRARRRATSIASACSTSS